MNTHSIDLTGLTLQQVNKIREMVQAFRNNSHLSPEDLDESIQDQELQELNDLSFKVTPIRDHLAFLNGYAPEDEGLYDDYPIG